jgi:hypothetical protein
MKTTLPYCCLLFSVAASNAAIISIGGSSSNWNSLGANYDFLNDQQTGDPASDIVGNATNPGFFTAFDNAGTSSLTDGNLGFRIRLDDHGGSTNTIEFGRNLWVGIDADLSGSIDAFLGLNMQGGTNEMGIFSPGSGLNTSPSTTSVASAPTAPYSYTPGVSNYNYREVNFGAVDSPLTDIGAVGPGTKAEPDYYVSFLIPFADVAAFLTNAMPTKFNATTPFTENTPIRYVLGTSTQVNSFNQDLGGIDGQVNSGLTWEVLGGFTPTTTPSGVPECSASLLAFIGSVLTFGFRRRR